MLTGSDVVLPLVKTKLLASSPIQNMATVLIPFSCLFLKLHPHVEDAGDEEQVSRQGASGHRHCPVAVDIVRRLVRTLGEANIASVLDIGAAAWEITCELPCSHGEPRIITNFHECRCRFLPCLSRSVKNLLSCSSPLILLNRQEQVLLAKSKNKNCSCCLLPSALSCRSNSLEQKY